MAVTVALEEWLERVRHVKKGAGLAQRLLAIWRENATHGSEESRRHTPLKRPSWLIDIAIR